MVSIKFLLYSACSALLTCGVIHYAVQKEVQFYPTVVYLSTSKGSSLVFFNMLIVLLGLLGYLVKYLFFGSLREAEVEHITDRIWPNVMETMFVMTIFRDEFGYPFASFFSICLAVKIFHWLVQDRVDYLEQEPVFSLFSHFRIVSLMFLLLACDLLFLVVCGSIYLNSPPSTMILFSFEFLLLVVSILSIIGKYILSAIDLRMETRWENKGSYILYLEFFSDFFKLLVYSVFFFLILKHYGLPLHLIRRIYLTLNSFRKRIVDIVQYHQIVNQMNERFPNATEQELAQNDSICIVCRDEMTSAKKLPCGHLLHGPCLRSWLERQRICPLCRVSLLDDPPPYYARQAGPIPQQPQPQQPQPQQQNEQMFYPEAGNNFSSASYATRSTTSSSSSSSAASSSPDGFTMEKYLNQLETLQRQNVGQPQLVKHLLEGYPDLIRYTINLESQIAELNDQILILQNQIESFHTVKFPNSGQSFSSPAFLDEANVSLTSSAPSSLTERELLESSEDDEKSLIRKRRLLRFSAGQNQK